MVGPNFQNFLNNINYGEIENNTKEIDISNNNKKNLIDRIKDKISKRKKN